MGSMQNEFYGPSLTVITTAKQSTPSLKYKGIYLKYKGFTT